MPYDIKEEELYNRAFFSFRYLGHLINVVFEPYDEPEYDYMFIIFSEDGQNIGNIEDPDFTVPLGEILSSFDKGNLLKYKVYLTC